MVNTELLTNVVDGFKQHFGGLPQILVQAPGRVNLIGEHTDYNGGFVLPCAINYQTCVGLGKRNDTKIKVIALDFHAQTDTFDLTQPIQFNDNRMWTNYIRGVVDQLTKRDFDIGGCDIVISGNVPQGAGLSSSASLEVAIAKAITEAHGIDVPALALAQIGQDAENQFVGCACGIMDQLISASGIEDHAVMIDCQNFSTLPVRLPDGLDIMIFNSNVQRGLVDSEYNLRRQQCETAATHYQAKLLREVSVQQLHAERDDLSLLDFNRARHVVEENERVLQMIDALKGSELKTLSRLMRESHLSMKSLFEITVPAIDLLVDTIDNALAGEGGVRMTGGGFGGCVVALVPSDKIDSVSKAVSNQYFSGTGLKETLYKARPTNGASVILQ